MPDTRYLKLKKGRWWFQIAVPLDLQERVGKQVIAKALETADTRKAQNDRWRHVAACKEWFARLRQQRPPTTGELAAEAAAELHAIYAQMKADPIGGPEGLQGWLHTITGDGESLDLDALRPRAQAIVERIGAAPTEESVRAMAGALANAAFTASEYWQRNIEPPALPGRPRRKGGRPFSEVAKEYVEDKNRVAEDAWTKQTRKMNEAVFRLFASHIDDAPISSVDRDDAVSFKNAMGKLRPDWSRSPKARGLPLSKLLEHFGANDGEAGLTNKTLARQANALFGLFEWAKTQNLYDQANPFFKLVKVSKKRSLGGSNDKTGWQSFSAGELTLLFNHPLLVDTSYAKRTRPKHHDWKTALMWAPAIALFTGMRINEVCGLAVEDVQRDNGVWFFDVNESNGRGLKTQAARRRIPVHSELQKLGFLDYVAHVREQRHKQLFPGLKPGGPDGKLGWFFTRKFTEYRRAVGVERTDTTTGRNRVGFHSFRSTVATALENARVPESEAVQILGHEKMSMSYGLYSSGLALRALRRAVEKIRYPKLDLAHLYKPTASERESAKGVNANA